jgi:glyoxylase-like metal-dependent hydrolase (beta-lactamase superfamily II)
MTPAEPGVVFDTGIYAIRNRRNCLYAIHSDDGHILIDAGSVASAVEKSIGRAGIDPLLVTDIFLTHTDYDHVASLPLFPNAKIHMSKEELQMVDGKTRRNSTKFNSLPAGCDTGALNLLTDGQVLDIGDHQIVCMKSAGHTPGSMSYLIDENYLFTGDAFKVRKGIVGIHPFTMDDAASRASIQKLTEAMQGCQLVLTAHYGYFTPQELIVASSV